MTSKFIIGDRVMYQAEGEEPLAGNIIGVSYNESGEPISYTVRLDNEQTITCSIDELSHLDVEKL